MKSATIPDNETERLAELYRYEILDTPYEKEFNDIVEITSQICNTPVSTISFIDSARQWCKAKVGLDEVSDSRDLAFCSHTILEDHLLEINDSLIDERFADNPLVTGNPNIRFYAGMPLITSDGFKIGVLCVIDTKPRKLSKEQIFALKVLTQQTIKLIELRLLNKELSHSLEMQKKIISIMSHDIRNPLMSLKSVLELHSNNALTKVESDEIFTKVNSSITRTLQMVNNLVDWSKIQLSYNNTTERILIYDLAEECIKQAELPAVLKNNILKNNIDKDLILNIDKQALTFILRNLISNANKFTENGSIRLYNYYNNNKTYLCVEDNGVGIEMSRVNELLEKPGKFISKGTHNEAGSGLGLSLIKNYLSKTGNELNIKSNKGKGTAVSFSLRHA